MSQKSSTRCVTPLCVDLIAKYGENNHRVYNNMLNVGVGCEGCGGMLVDGVWRHRCDACGVDVEPGKLTGLFVPHLCAACEQRQTDENLAAGRVCGRCHDPSNRCCC